MEKIKFETPIKHEIIELKNNTSRCKTFQYYDTIERIDGGYETMPMNKDEIVSLMEGIIRTKDKYKNSWFWSNNGNSDNRSNRENWACGVFAFAWEGDVYCYELDFTMSRKYVYMNVNKLTKNGSGSLRDWKKLMSKLRSAEDGSSEKESG